MTMKHFLSRSLVAMSAVFTFTMIAAPSAARAETRSQITMSPTTVECPACQLLKSYDQDGLSFRDVVAEQNGNQIVVTAQVAMAATAGKPRSGSVVLTAFTNADGSFMDYTDDACTPWQMTRQAGEQACDAISSALRAPVTTTVPGPVLTTPSTPTEGIIMRDGGVCDPIRHMGC
jgi:hypothetical protein